MNKIKKYILPPFLALFLLFSFAPSAQADTGDVVGWALGGIFGAAINGVAGVISLILIPVLGLIVFLSAQVFDWLLLMTSAFAGSPVVTSAWTFLRDMANVSFIFILLIIAISMILRIGKYSDTKLIFRLMVAALLINFSRIIALAIVDFSQILTDFFITQATAGGGGLTNNIMNQLYAGKILQASQAVSSGFGGGTAAVSALTVSQIMNIIVIAGIAVFFALGAFMMLIRLVALVILVIIAPLAFIAYILPDMQKYWKMWWEKLIKYSVFAPAFTFFLYLALTFPRASMGALTDGVPGVEFGGIGISSAFFASGEILMIYIITLAFLYGGVFMAQSLSMHSGNKTVNWVNKKSRAAGKWAQTNSWGKVKEKFAQGVSGQKMKLFGKEIGGAGYWTGKGLEGVGKAGAAARKVHKTAPWYAKPATALVGVAAGGAAARAAHLPIIAKQKLQAENKKILDQYKDWDDHDIEAQIKAGTIPSKHAAILATEKLAPKGKAMKIGEDKVQELIKIMITNHMNVNNVLKNDPALVDRLSSELKEKLAKSLGKTVSGLTSKSILEKMKANELSWLSGETINAMKDDIQELIVQGAITHNHLSGLYGSDNIESMSAMSEILNTIESRLDEFPDIPKKTVQWISGQAQTIINQGEESE